MKPIKLSDAQMDAALGSPPDVYVTRDQQGYAIASYPTYEAAARELLRDIARQASGLKPGELDYRTLTISVKGRGN